MSVLRPTTAPAGRGWRHGLAASGSAWLVLLLLVAASSCSHGPPPAAAGERRQLEKLPFYPDDRHRCGPATLAAVLGYWQDRVTPEEVDNAIFSPTAKGTLTFDMAWYARQRGFQAVVVDGSLERLRELIDAGIPPLILIDYAFGPHSANHYLVIAGYTPDGFIVNSDTRAGQHLSNQKLDRLWKRRQHWLLVVLPPGRDLPWSS